VFCDVSLAARIERAEVELLREACANVRLRLPDVLTLDVGGGLALCTEPGSPLNKVAGLGFAQFDEGEWLQIEESHRQRRAPMQVEISTLADPTVAKFLTSRGFELVGVENVLGRSLDADMAPGDHGCVAISRSDAGDLQSWMDVMTTGFATPDTQGVPTHESFDRAALERIIRDFAAAPGVVRYLAQRGGDNAGAATMRMAGGIAQLCGAATLPLHRRRGVQSALLDNRLANAGREGCTLAVMTTHPGSKSQQNAMRHGFMLLYSRVILLRKSE
jgi:ribosomal protein S18 acetylase RimI-like enzyme